MATNPPGQGTAAAEYRGVASSGSPETVPPSSSHTSPKSPGKQKYKMLKKVALNPTCALSRELTAFPKKKRVAISAELEKERRRLMQSHTMNTPGASVSLAQPSVKELKDNEEQQHIAAQQKIALQHAHAHSSGFFITQDSFFGNLILLVLPRLEPKS